MNLHRKNKKGFILFVVLAILAALTLVVINLIEIVGHERELSDDYLLKTRSRLMAYSGVEYGLSQLSSKNIRDSYRVTGDYSVGGGTYINNGDCFVLSTNDSNAKININDGVEAGYLESLEDAQRNVSINWLYDASEVNPWPSAGVTQLAINNNLTTKTVSYPAGTLDKSGLINLRLRRLLNAYGDVHMAMDKDLISTAAGSLPSGFKLTSSSAGNRGISAPAVEGLGDAIISQRPSTGYAHIYEIKVIVNIWADTVIDSSYYNAEFDSFFDKIKGDLTVRSYEDTNFNRLRTELAATYDATEPTNVNTCLSPHMWLYQNSMADPSLSGPGDPKFIPNYLDRFPINLTDDSGNGTLDVDGNTIDEDNNLWASHSVALINMTAASEAVKAAVFYAPVNVSYLCESAVTHLGQEATWHTNSTRTRTDPDIRDDTWRTERAIGRSSIGVRGVCFNPDKHYENGFLDAGYISEVQINHFMSLRDALHLAKYYEWSVWSDTQTPYNFDEFKNLITTYRKEKRLGTINASSQVPNDSIAFERAEPIPLNNDKSIKFDVGAPSYEIHYGGDSDHKVRATFIDNNNVDYVDIVWVSQYWPRDPANLLGEWDGGWFLEDYVERTLPHVLSCVRRIPGYLGAPLALTSPYMILEPYSYVGPNHATPRHRLGSYTEAWVWWGARTWPALPDTFTSSTEASKHLGKQPKVSVEDLVTRHTLPKICFLPNGVFDIECTGTVKNPAQEIIAQTSVSTTVELFNVKKYRTQEDFISLLSKNSTTGEVNIGTNSDETHPDIVIGPEFKVKDKTVTPFTLAGRVTSKYWLALGCRDADSMAGKKYSGGPSSGEPYMPSNPDGQPSATGDDDHVKSWDLFLTGNPYDANGGLNNESNVNTILPDYGTLEWKSLSLEDERNLVNTSFLSEYFLFRSFIPAGSIFQKMRNSGMPLPHNILLPGRYTGTVSLGSPEFNEKLESRLLVHHGSNIKREGELENSRDHLWGQKDPHDLDPFGQGIFLSSNANGEFADVDPNPDPMNVDASTGFSYAPKTYRDTLYWPLNTKLKNFDKIADVDRDGILDDTGGIVGIPDVYELEDQVIGSPFSATEGDVNSVGVGFHRGFMASWFRAPTSYPFAHPVYYFGQDVAFGWLGWGENYLDDHVRNKTHLFKTILSLNVNPTLRWDLPDNSLNTPKSDSTHLNQFSSTTPTGYNNIDIKVGYYSGFDVDRNHEFEHGVVGYYNTTRYTSGVIMPSMSSTKHDLGDYNHPLALTPSPDPSKLNNKFYNKVYGYFWDYDWMQPTPYVWDDYALTGTYQKPAWGLGSIDTGYVYQKPTFQAGWRNSTNAVHIPIYHMAWKQDYGGMIANRANEDLAYTGLYPTLPVNNMFYASHSARRGAYGTYMMEIKHKLRMNSTPECAPGSWHRVYAFWFMRFNPGQMGVQDDNYLEMGDSYVHSQSLYWSDIEVDAGSGLTGYELYHKTRALAVPSTTEEYPICKRIVDGGVYPNVSALLPHEATTSAAVFISGRSRYAEDDAAITAASSSYVNTNAAFDVDGLDQFGIWFRDDSNYVDWCSNPGNNTGFNSKSVKPTFSSLLNTTEERFHEIGTNMNNSNNHLSIGCSQFRRSAAYTPASGEGRYSFRSAAIPFSWNLNSDPDHYRRAFPAYILDSTVDDVIFAYGSDISVPYIPSGTANWGGTYPNSSEVYRGNNLNQSSYFRGLFHNAYWLADQSDPYERHADEVRYDIRSSNHPKVLDGSLSVNQPQLNMNLSVNDPVIAPVIPNTSRILHTGCRIYFPAESLINNQFNCSDLRMDVLQSGVSKLSTDPNDRSSNYQDYFFDDTLTTNSLKDLTIIFKYTGNKREKDYSDGTTSVVYQSTIFNLNQDYGFNTYDAAPNGDSFTNIPYLQEFTIRYQVNKGIKYLRWYEP